MKHPLFLIYCTIALIINTAQATTQQELAFIKSFIPESSLIFDVGAHHGLKTDIYLAHNATVICIEPQPSCLKILRKKYKNNQKVVIVPQGLSNISGTMKLYICDTAPTISTFSTEWQHGRFENYTWGKTVPVPVTTLDHLIKKYGIPYFCKIDVEGFEEMVLKGLSTPIPVVSFEFTKEFFKNSKSCIQYLENLGYKNFNYTLGENLQFIHASPLTSIELTQEIEASADRLLWGDIYATY